MSVHTIAFFNNKGGVGKTTLIYHLAHRLADEGHRVLLADFDPQSNLSAMCLDDERLEQLWAHEGAGRKTIRGAVEPLVQGIGDVASPHIEELTPSLALLPGDIRLATFESNLSSAWSECVDRRPPGFRVTSSLHRALQMAALEHQATVAMIDVGPNLGAINRAALLGAEHIVIPLGADLFSIQGLRNLAPMLGAWRMEWESRLELNPVADLELPAGRLQPLGYVVMQPAVYAGRVTRAYERWLSRIPAEYAALKERTIEHGLSVNNDPACLGVLRHYRSLMPLAQEARKPIFHLTTADGALGAHLSAARKAGEEFGQIARSLLERIGSLA